MPSDNSRTDSNHAQVPSAQILKEKKRIFVGVDFGTSTTKVMYRPVELGGLTRLVDFSHGHRNFPSYAMPSSVRLDDENRLWFGTIAEVGHGQMFRSFKVCVACQVGAISCRGCNQSIAKRDVSHAGRLADGLFGFIPAHELMVYYLAWLSQEVERNIRNSLEGFVEAGLQYNLGVPVAHLNAEPTLVDRFEWILHTALKLRGAIYQGITLASARSLLIEILPNALLPQSQSRQHRALPETAAAALWLQKTIDDVDHENFLLIDIGAGTTDITIYKYDRANPNLPIYGARTIPIASDNVDFATIQWFARQLGVSIEMPAQLSSAILQSVRCRKELVPRPNRPMEARLGDRILALDEMTYVRELVHPQTAKIFDAVSATFSDAYHLARRVQFWQEIKIVMLGGGSRIVGMKDYFGAKELRSFMEQKFVDPMVPQNLESVNVCDFQLLAVAFGLAFPPADLPGIRPPSQIQPLPPCKPDPEPEYDANTLLSN